ncbi:MAG: DNA/RNA nuclease SfsA [Paracoccaceae bacterium]|uniref:DNA/RNA nuclease SfsA n=1 Tax=Candidatus Salinivivens marinus TaxID=3381703 RepID=UPI000BDFEA4C|nr:MAG: DNA/RNA nuclease SfsA [Rhodobacteraceae bacterium MED-G08]|tara:strand:+ start:1383 stop:2096 length:714 start_codon:yes stop_codon:yes gene_type:complete
MQFQSNLVSGRLVKRYKRFFADVELSNGRIVTAHCPNTGSMLGLANHGVKVWLEPNENPKKKLKYSWKLVDHENGHFTGVDTNVANKIVNEALLQGKILEVLDYDIILREQIYGANSRVDFLLRNGSKTCYLEVKSVTLCRQEKIAEFPDTVTSRGAKHLKELSKTVSTNTRAIVLYLVQRSDCNYFKIAGDLDQTYLNETISSSNSGVEFVSYRVNFLSNGIELGYKLELIDNSSF